MPGKRWSAIIFAIVAVLACDRTARRDPALRDALLRRVSRDQSSMQELAAHIADNTYHQRLAATLRSNAVWLDSVVTDRGWPGVIMADSDGTAAAFLIAQHADSQPAIQCKFFAALRQAVARKDASPMNLAFLEDRIQHAAGLPQVYGTQAAYDSAGTAIQPPVTAPESLDVRRKAVGLPPMAIYLEKMRALNAQLRAMKHAPSK